MTGPREAAIAAKSLAGQTVVVTGSNSGIGKETAQALAAAGATVVLACRRKDAAEAAAADIREAVPGADVSVQVLDVGSLASVRAFAQTFERPERPLMVLVNNAGVNFWTPSAVVSPEGVPEQAQTNYLGPYLLTRLLTGALARGAATSKRPSRIVNVSSVTHRMQSSRITDAADFLKTPSRGKYGHTKLANVLHAYEAQRRLGGQQIVACAVDPGGVRSGIWAGGPLAPGAAMHWIQNAFLSPAADGARAVIDAALLPLETLAPPGAPAASGGGRFYARGAFARPPITQELGFGKTLNNLAIAFPAALDYSLRWLTGGNGFMDRTLAVKSVARSYDEQLAKSLWEESARLCGLPP